MDPHMTREDREEYAEFDHHRRLNQRLATPSPVKTAKKKKLVNFKVSRRIRSVRKSTKERRESASSSGSVYMSTDIPLTEMKESGNKHDENKTATGRRNSDELNYNRSREEEEDRYFSDTRDEFRSLGNQRRDNRSVKERREDFRRIHERKSNTKPVSERRGGILHISEEKHEGAVSMDEDEKNHNAGEAVGQEAHPSGNDRNGNPTMGNPHRRKSDPKDLDLPKPLPGNASRRGTLEKIEYQPTGNPHRRKSDPKALDLPKSLPIADNRRAASNKNETSKSMGNTKSIVTQRRRSAAAALTQRSHSTSSWDRVRGAAVTEGRTARLSTVVEMITTRRRTSVAPTLWTPAVPRSPPGPRPANFSDQEEPGKRTFIISFITRPPKSRQRSSTLRQRRQQPSLLYRAPTSHWEASGKQYLAWLGDLVANPLLQEGHLLLGLEIGVQFSAIHLKETYPDGAASGGERRLLEGSLGGDCILSQGVYEEVVSWVPELLVTCPSDPSQWARCYIMLGFMTLEGELNKKMETLWKEWTGALYVYCNVDDDLGLKKLTFFRRHSEHQVNLFSYLVLIELDTVTKKNCLQLLDFVYRMRLRNMSGYISVYQCHYPDSGLTMVPGGSPVSLRARSPINTSSTDSHVDKTNLDFDRLAL